MFLRCQCGSFQELRVLRPIKGEYAKRGLLTRSARLMQSIPSLGAERGLHHQCYCYHHASVGLEPILLLALPALLVLFLLFLPALLFAVFELLRCRAALAFSLIFNVH